MRVATKKNNIYQIYFKENQRANLNKEFIPYFKSENEEIEWREYWTFVKNKRHAIASKGLTGYVSWKFQKKSKVTPQKFLDFIEKNPGFDVYFLNPFPLDALLFESVWQHGDFYHPGLTEFTASLLRKAGYEIDILGQTNRPDQAGYSNYWVANSKFWKLYTQFTRPLEQYIRHQLTPDESKYLYTIADPVSNCSHIPFIFERMFTTLLVHNKELRSISYEYDADDLRERYPLLLRLIYRVLKKTQINRSWFGKLLKISVLLLRKIRDNQHG
jgi:hypothetical protein